MGRRDKLKGRKIQKYYAPKRGKKRYKYMANEIVNILCLFISCYFLRCDQAVIPAPNRVLIIIIGRMHKSKSNHICIQRVIMYFLRSFQYLKLQNIGPLFPLFDLCLCVF